MALWIISYHLNISEFYLYIHNQRDWLCLTLSGVLLLSLSFRKMTLLNTAKVLPSHWWILYLHKPPPQGHFQKFAGVAMMCTLHCHSIPTTLLPLRGSIVLLSHWGRVTHIRVKVTVIGSDNGLSPGRRQAIIWTIAGILIIGPLGTNFSENLIEIVTFSFMKMRLKVSSAKWRPFCLGLNELICIFTTHSNVSSAHSNATPKVHHIATLLLSLQCHPHSTFQYHSQSTT